VQHFTADDDISGINSDVIYYRLKVIGKDGAVKYSNILVVRKNGDKAQVLLSPNPAHTQMTVKLHSEAAAVAHIAMIDYNGKVVRSSKEKLNRGFNYIRFADLKRFANAVYELRIVIGDMVISKTFIIQN
jgi:Secretion system C-terminal sorting domain